MELAATHFGLTIEPPVVPPGGTLVLRYRAVNHGAVPAPPATVEFLIDPAAVDELPEPLELGILAPGECRDVRVTVQLSPLVRNGGRVQVQAALAVGDAAPLGSNVAVAHVRGRAQLAATPSRLVLRPCGAASCTLDAELMNTGDAASGETRLTIELPAGLGTPEGARRLDRRIPPLDPGASATVHVVLTIDGHVALPLQILDAALTDADGRRVALPPSDPVEPEREPPALTLALERFGRRIDARITIGNPNAAALTDLALDASWPRAFRLADGSVLIDGRTPLRAGARAAAATLKTTVAGATIALARIAPRGTATLSFSGYAAAAADGEVTIALRSVTGERTARAALPIGHACGPTLALAAGTQAVIAGGEAVADAILTGGDEACSIRFGTDDPALRVIVDGSPLGPEAAVALAAGTRRDVQIVAPVGGGCADGTTIERIIRATSDRGETAELAIAFTVRSRAWLEIAEWLVPADGGARIAIANAGSTSASAVRLDGADGYALALGTIAPGETVVRIIDAPAAAAFAAGARLQHAACAEPVLLAPLRTPAEESAAIAFALPREVHEGIAFDVRWTIALPAGAHTLAVRCAEHAGLAIVPGSTTIDDHAIVDGMRARIAEGIVLHDVPAGTRIAFAARGIARAPGAIAVAVATTLDGGDERIASETIAAAPRAAFPQKPGGLRFYLDAPAIDAPATDVPLPDARESSAEMTTVIDVDRAAQLARAVQRAGVDPIADALGVLAALMPAGAPRDAFGENAERLSVKLRIPGYVAEAEDYESVAARSALDRARGEAGSGPLAAPRGSVAALAVWCATIDPRSAPGLPIAAYLAAFVRFVDDRQPADRQALETARTQLRSALAVRA